MQDLGNFPDYLAEQGRGPLAVAGYTQDLALFADWFEHTNGEPLTPAALTLTDAANIGNTVAPQGQACRHQPPGRIREMGNATESRAQQGFPTRTKKGAAV